MENIQNVYVNGQGNVNLVKAGRYIKAKCHKNPMVDCNHKCIAWQEDETGSFITLACMPGVVLSIEKDSRKKPENAITSGSERIALPAAQPRQKQVEEEDDNWGAKKAKPAKATKPTLEDSWN